MNDLAALSQIIRERGWDIYRIARVSEDGAVEEVTLRKGNRCTNVYSIAKAFCVAAAGAGFAACLLSVLWRARSSFCDRYWHSLPRRSRMLSRRQGFLVSMTVPMKIYPFAAITYGKRCFQGLPPLLRRPNGRFFV